MDALGPAMFPTFGWALTGEYESYSVVGDNNIDGTVFDFPVPNTYGVVHQQQTSLVDSVSSKGIGIDKNSVVIKKLNHNAGERNRREKTNCLFSSLLSCLPKTDETKKPSIPQTLSRSLQYIPELQKEVKKLIQKKEDLLARVSGQREIYVKLQPEVAASYFSTVFATKVKDNEVMVQISSSKIHIFSIYNVLSGLEADGFALVDVSSSISRGDRLLYTLNLQVDKVDNEKLIFEELCQRILYFYEQCGNSFM